MIEPTLGSVGVDDLQPSQSRAAGREFRGGEGLGPGLEQDFDLPLTPRLELPAGHQAIHPARTPGLGPLEPRTGEESALGLGSGELVSHQFHRHLRIGDAQVNSMDADPSRIGDQNPAVTGQSQKSSSRESMPRDLGHHRSRVCETGAQRVMESSHELPHPRAIEGHHFVQIQSSAERRPGVADSNRSRARALIDEEVLKLPQPLQGQGVPPPPIETENPSRLIALGVEKGSLHGSREMGGASGPATAGHDHHRGE